VFATMIITRSLALRIREAYVRRRPWWPATDPFTPVWAIAATSLIEAHQADPRLPLDPELFVASQPGDDGLADPWGDLVGTVAVRRYRGRIIRIVRRLRRELLAELRTIRVRVRHGQPLGRLLLRGGHGLSPLGRYVFAVRAGRDDLAASLRQEALRQHRSCPLYRLACRRLLAGADYPASSEVALIEPLPAGSVSWN